MPRLRPALLAFVLAIAALAAAACGGGGQQKSEDGLKKAARQAAESMVAGNYRAAYDAYAKECRDQVDFNEFEANARLAVVFVEAFLGVKLKDFNVTDVQVRNFTGDAGEVSVTIKPPKDIPGFDDLDEPGTFEPWKWEDNRWVVADCAALSDGGFFGGDGDGGDSSGAVPTVPPAGSGPRLGEEVTAGKAVVRVLTVEDPARVPNVDPNPGNRYIALDVSVQATSDRVSVSPFDFTVQDADGYVYDSTYFGREPALGSTDLAPGRTIRGWVTFEVPADARLVAAYASLDWPRPDTLILDFTRR